MSLHPTLLIAVLALVIGWAHPALAGENDPLFINLTTDHPHRADMAIGFGAKQFERGHPLTIFLNDTGVLLGSTRNASAYADHQARLATLMEQGAVVIVCPMCMKHHGVTAADLLPGAQVGNPELTGGALFKDQTRTLTW